MGKYFDFSNDPDAQKSFDECWDRAEKDDLPMDNLLINLQIQNNILFRRKYEVFSMLTTINPVAAYAIFEKFKKYINKGENYYFQEQQFLDGWGLYLNLLKDERRSKQWEPKNEKRKEEQSTINGQGE